MITQFLLVISLASSAMTMSPFKFLSSVPFIEAKDLVPTKWMALPLKGGSSTLSFRSLFPIELPETSLLVMLAGVTSSSTDLSAPWHLVLITVTGCFGHHVRVMCNLPRPLILSPVGHTSRCQTLQCRLFCLLLSSPKAAVAVAGLRHHPDMASLQAALQDRHTSNTHYTQCRPGRLLATNS